MKKLTIAVFAVLAATLAFGTTGCIPRERPGQETEPGAAAEPEPTGSPVAVGDWTLNSTPIVTANAARLLENGLQGYTGATFDAVAYVATQAVEGTNHLLVCRRTKVASDTAETWVLVTLYQDPQNEVTITCVQDFGVPTHLDGMAGSWQLAKSPKIDDGLAATFGKALEGWTGAAIEPVALLSTQVVSGTNYLVFAKVTPVVRDTQPFWGLATFYVDLQGGASVKTLVGF